ncbi:MAG: phosphatidate cytidylyltransferase [Polaribacter sp.]|nr:phosphatidate cytidylyltransferase [Polaribacter sp.]
MSDVTKRILTGTAYVTLLLFVIMEPTYALVLFSLVAILATLELKKIFEKQNLDFHTWPAIIIGLTSYLTLIYSEIIFILFLEIIIYFISLLLQTRNNTLILAGGTLFSVIYIFIPLSLVIPIGVFENEIYNYKILFGLLILIWSSDSWAFVCGKLFGRHKLSERISPNKTWEGFIGSIILTTATGYVISNNGFGLSQIEWMILGTLTSISATVGDLFQSMLKRESNIKDSGNILPGHGGILDRFDSILLCFPIFYLYLYYINPILNY